MGTKHFTLILLLFAVKLGFAQDTTNISSSINSWLNGSKANFTLKLPQGDVEIGNPVIVKRESKALINAIAIAPKGDFLFKNFNGNVSGYLHFENGKLAYQIQKIEDKIVLISVPLKRRTQRLGTRNGKWLYTLHHLEYWRLQ
ncbi:MAG: hypothetical protein ACO3EE_03700 [Flavobacteriales bacterium]